jgi:hypothetical protein
MPAPLPVVGVMPPACASCPIPAPRPTQLRPRTPRSTSARHDPDETNASAAPATRIARLKPGVTAAQAQRELAAMSAGIAQAILGSSG